MSLLHVNVVQVCMLPPAWGYEPHGLERYITSFPVATVSGQCTRILRAEADPRTVRVCKAREDTWAHVISLAKIGAGLRVSNQVSDLLGTTHVLACACHFMFVRFPPFGCRWLAEDVDTLFKAI